MQAQEFTTQDTQSLIQTKPLTAWVVFCQIIAWLIAKCLTVVMNRNKTLHLEAKDLDPTKDYVIAASHASMLDPFLIIGQVNLQIFLRLLPFRFFAHNGLFSWWLRPILMSLGCFPASGHPKYMHGLTAANTFLDRGETVMIFPEGKRFKGEKLKPRPGVSILAARENVQIIPVKIVWHRGLIWRYDIVIGKPQRWAGRNADEILFDILTLE